MDNSATLNTSERTPRFDDLSKTPFLLALTASGVLLGSVVAFTASTRLGAAVWAATTAVALLPLSSAVLRSLARRKPGVDVIALLAMAGALILGEYLAGAVIALMLTGGQALEAYAGRRAREELLTLLERAPRTTQRYDGRALISVDIREVHTGDMLLVRPGEVVPVDGLVVGSAAVLDESTLTGESRPITRQAGDRVCSGTVNAGGPFDLRATATAEQSTYAGIVRLVQTAEASKAPLVRLADRYALVFLPVTLLLSATAWVISGDPVRALSVLVVATPCPLILAAPVAIVSGISRAARRGIVFKSGAALESLARARVLLLDKTGTLTTGVPLLSELETFGRYDHNELLRLAASLDQVSPHVLASAIVRASQERRLKLSIPAEVSEQPGSGIRGQVDGHRVEVGSASWVRGKSPLPPRARQLRRRTSLEGSANVFVAIDGQLEGMLILDDPLRSESPRTIRALRRAGIKRIVTLTGDHPELAEVVGAAIGADAVLAERSPTDKVEAVRAESKWDITAMVGDGINDAPALAAAHVGVAMGARGATASSEAADVVLTSDRLDRLVDALDISRRARAIALQSVWAGMGLSVGGMLFALGGWVSPIAGALLQEAIDTAVILNALRALQDNGHKLGNESVMLSDFKAEHQSLKPKVRQLRLVADRLGQLPAEDARAQLEQVRQFLVDELIPHEKVDDNTLYPFVAELMGGEDPTGTMSRAHLEIAHLSRLYLRILEDLPADEISAEDLRDLRRVLYGLDALLRLHFAQEEEHYLQLLEERAGV